LRAPHHKYAALSSSAFPQPVLALLLCRYFAYQLSSFSMANRRRHLPSCQVPADSKQRPFETACFPFSLHAFEVPTPCSTPHTSLLRQKQVRRDQRCEQMRFLAKKCQFQGCYANRCEELRISEGSQCFASIFSQFASKMCEVDQLHGGKGLIRLPAQRWASPAKRRENLNATHDRQQRSDNQPVWRSEIRPVSFPMIRAALNWNSPSL
jgi:hypothetical protein